jgi:hypothetical protein
VNLRRLLVVGAAPLIGAVLSGPAHAEPGAAPGYDVDSTCGAWIASIDIPEDIESIDYAVETDRGVLDSGELPAGEWNAVYPVGDETWLSLTVGDDEPFVVERADDLCAATVGEPAPVGAAPGADTAAGGGAWAAANSPVTIAIALALALVVGLVAVFAVMRRRGEA